MKNIRLQYAAWEQLPPDFQSLFTGWMDGDPARGRAFYELYFYWFDIPHEVGHVLCEQVGRTDPNHWDDEVAVNTLATAYWRERGETQKLAQLHNHVRHIMATLPDPLPPGEDRRSYFDRRYSELAYDPMAFGHFHFTMVLAALDAPQSLTQALQTYVSPQIEHVTLPPAVYPAVTRDLPPCIVQDMRADLSPCGLILPEMQITCAFSPELLFVVWDN